MKVHEIKQQLDELDGGWVNREKTVDTFKSGNPNKEVTGIAVAWMGYTDTIQKALDLNCNVLVVHEPIYYDHWDKDTSMFRFEEAQKKKELIDSSGITILRCHDLWDQVKEIGVPDSWGDSLGFGKAIAGEGYFRVYDGSGCNALEVANRIAKSVKKYGQESVQLIGPVDKHIKRFVVGTGAATPFMEMMETYPDVQLFVCSDDGFVYWRDGAMAIDFQIPVVVLNHPVTEFAGIQNLYAYLKGQYPETPIHFIEQNCMYLNIK